MPVDMVHIHHEGGGAPCTVAQAERFRHGGYCAPICTDGWVRWCAPADNYATADWNGRDLTLCFSGSRGNTDPAYEVTDHDITVVHDAFMDFYKRGEVTADPSVVAHRDAGGSNSTACPGDLAMARMDDIAAACRADTQPTPPAPKPQEDDVADLAAVFNHEGRPMIVQVGNDKRLYYRVRNSSGGSWGAWADLSGGKTGFATVAAFANADKKIEVWVTMADGHSFNRWQNDDLTTWSGWADQTR